MATEKQGLIHHGAVAAADLSAYQYYLVKLSSSGWDLCTTQGEAGLIGILLNDPESGEVANVMLLGKGKAKLGGTVALGDPLCVTTAGKLIKASDQDEFVIARAVAAGVANDIGEVIMGVGGGAAAGVYADQEGYTSSANYATTGQYCAVKAHTTAGQIVKCSVAGERALGILQNAPAASAEADVCTYGECTAIAGTGGVAAGDKITTDASGHVVTASGNAQVLGWAVAAIADTESGTIFFAPVGMYSVDGSALDDTKIWVGNGSNIAAAVAVSGDATLANDGAITISNDKVTAAKMASTAGAGSGIVFKGTNTANAITELNVPSGSLVVGTTNDVTILAVGNGGHKLTVNGAGTAPVWDNNKIVKAIFSGMNANDDPILTEWDWTAAPGTTGALCRCQLPCGVDLGYFPLGAGQTILGPVGATDGIDIGCDQTDDEGLEVFSNAYWASGKPLAVGRDAAFYFLCKINIQLINGTDDLFIGFRKVETVNADAEAYNTYFGLGINTAASPGLLKVRDELNGGGAANTTTTQTIASATDLQVKILISAAGVATLQHDAAVPGTLAAPSATHALTFDDGDRLMPYCRFLHANVAQAGTVVIKDWEVGFQ